MVSYKKFVYGDDVILFKIRISNSYRNIEMGNKIDLKYFSLHRFDRYCGGKIILHLSGITKSYLL
jgi:hypothetical protein